MKKIRKRLTYANVMSSIAVFLVLGGATAVAASKIGSKQLKANSVTTGKIKKNAVTTAKIKNNAVNGAKVNENTLGPVPVANSLAYATQLKLTKATSSATGATDAAGAAAATSVTLYDDSHFTVYGKCYVDSSGPVLRARVFIATKQDGAIFDSDDDELDGAAPDGYLNTGTAETLREVMNIAIPANSADIQYEGDTEFGATAADGYTIHGNAPIAAKFGAPAAGNGPYGDGDVCLFGSTVAHS